MNTTKGLQRFKKCPEGHQNETTADACTTCSWGLENEIYILCGNCGKELLENETCTCCSSPDQYKYCPSCGSRNSPDAEKCCKCSQLLDPTGDALPRIYCESYPGFEVALRDGYVIGREGNIDVTGLPKSNFISRKHATFLCQRNAWFIRAESTTNPTKVNFKVLEQGQTQRLKDNDRIILADTIFIFRST